MARQLSRWALATLAACAVVAVAYLPPRGTAAPRVSWTFWDRPTSSVHREAQRLAEAWRHASHAVRLAEARYRFEQAFAHRRASDIPGAALLITTDDSVPAEFERTVRQALDSVWHDLGLGVSKVAVGVELDVARGPRTADADLPPVPRVRSYLLPDSTDRAACVAYVPAQGWQFTLNRTPPEKRAEQVEYWIRGGLGPCGFFAAFGTPGQPVRRWLGNRRYSLAVRPDWGSPRPPSEQGWAAYVGGAATGRWSWRHFGMLPFSTVACLGGRITTCAEAVLDGSGVSARDSLPRVVSLSRWWWRDERLLNEERFLSDVVRDVGHDRFQTFWSATDGVHPSLQAALGAPIGEWTAAWHWQSVPRIPLGPAVSWFAGVTGVLLSAVAVLAATLATARREVR